MKKKIIIIFLIILIILIIFAILLFNFKSYNFILNGNETITLDIGSNWNDPGFTLSKGDIVVNEKVNVTSNVNLNTIGTYEIRYSYSSFPFHKTIIRKIIVDDNTNLSFTLNDDTNYYLLINNPYHEPGFKAIDKIDGDITSKVISSGFINEKQIGIYDLTYSITNSNGVTKNLIRHINVYELNNTFNIETEDYVKGNNKISILINDSNYNYIILPDNIKDSSEKIEYTVSQNGIYTFKIYDKHDNFIEKEIEIKNIDNTPPTGACEYSLYDNNGEIKVNATDNVEIKNYLYKYGNNQSNKITNNTFNVNTLDNNAKVIIEDSAGNTTEITCTNINKATIIPRSYNTYYHKGGDSETSFNYWFYMPKNSKREKIPLLLYFHGDGGKGSNPNLVNNYAYPNFISKGMDFPFAMIAPQVNNGDTFMSTYYQNGVYKLLKEILANYNIDPNRVIVAGGSSGADGAYKAISMYKNIFSCGVIASGTIYTIDQIGINNLVGIPLWFFHGENDTHLSHTAMEARIEKLKNLGANVKYTLIPNGGHEITETVFKREDLIDWMITQKKK